MSKLFLFFYLVLLSSLGVLLSLSDYMTTFEVLLVIYLGINGGFILGTFDELLEGTR